MSNHTTWISREHGSCSAKMAIFYAERVNFFLFFFEECNFLTMREIRVDMRMKHSLSNCWIRALV